MLGEVRHFKKTRKDHICEYCLRVIPKGSPARYECGTYDGFYSRYCCEECAQYMEDFWRWCDYECGDLYTDFRDFVLENNLPHSVFRQEEDE